MTYRLFDEMDYLKRRLENCASEMAHIQKRIEIVEQSLFSSLTEIDGLPVIVAHIMYQCANEYGVSVETIRDGSQGRGVDLNSARNLAIFRIKELGRFKMGQIAQWFKIPTPTAVAARTKGRLLDMEKKVKEKA